MSQKQSYELEPIPAEISQLAWKMSPKGTVTMHLRDALGPIYKDQDFSHLFPTWERPAEAPARLALITVLQAVEGLSETPSRIVCNDG